MKNFSRQAEVDLQARLIELKRRFESASIDFADKLIEQGNNATDRLGEEIKAIVELRREIDIASRSLADRRSRHAW